MGKQTHHAMQLGQLVSLKTLRLNQPPFLQSISDLRSWIGSKHHASAFPSIAAIRIVSIGLGFKLLDQLIGRQALDVVLEVNHYALNNPCCYRWGELHGAALADKGF